MNKIKTFYQVEESLDGGKKWFRATVHYHGKESWEFVRMGSLKEARKFIQDADKVCHGSRMVGSIGVKFGEDIEKTFRIGERH